MSKTFKRVFALVFALSLVAAACGGDDDDDDAGGDDTTEDTGDTDSDIDYEGIGLWDDGPCDGARPPLVIGLMTIFQSPLLSLEDQAIALEASAEAFNARGGANGACIEVHTCDDGGTVDQATACAREIVDAGVVVTVNDQGTAGQDEVSQAMAAAQIPRVASNVAQQDWDDPNAYPLDASGTGVTFLLPQALIEEDVNEIGVIRVPLAAASALTGFLETVYEGDATFPYAVPVPEGTTDYSQFIIGAQNEGVGGVTLAVGEQDAIQLVRAGQQLNTPLLVGASLGSFSHSTAADFADLGDQMVYLWSFAPATADLPVYDALRADLAASGEESLRAENLKASPMRSWIGLYALLKMMRDAGMQEFTGPAITAMLQQAQDVPMLDMFGGENWTPNADHPGAFKRAGIDRWVIYGWDPDTQSGGFDGNFVERSEISFDETLCDSALGGPC